MTTMSAAAAANVVGGGQGRKHQKTNEGDVRLVAK